MCLPDPHHHRFTIVLCVVTVCVIAGVNVIMVTISETVPICASVDRLVRSHMLYYIVDV